MYLFIFTTSTYLSSSIYLYVFGYTVYKYCRHLRILESVYSVDFHIYARKCMPRSFSPAHLQQGVTILLGSLGLTCVLKFQTGLRLFRITSVVAFWVPSLTTQNGSEFLRASLFGRPFAPTTLNKITPCEGQSGIRLC